MALRVVEDLCIGCGACDFSCPTNALHKTDSFLGLFAIDPLTCDDCGICVGKCPELAIVPDPAWPVCHGRGCPLTSKRLAGTECSIWQDRCPSCGSTLWKTDSPQWWCPHCDHHLRVGCPKSHHDEAHATVDVELTRGGPSH
jgi:NAD-dependent dihydropyrimidine dehydrogenase PreA subunit